ncbi:hypothetical protein GOBAR_DD10517 [Gossypium barbadense]|nr:hypothetical protein GOBAR_DD10517 [Gossypium barbadense]
MAFPHISKTFVSGGIMYFGLRTPRREITEEMLGNLNINAISEEKSEERSTSGIYPVEPGSVLNNWTAEEMPEVFRAFSEMSIEPTSIEGRVTPPTSIDSENSGVGASIQTKGTTGKRKAPPQSYKAPLHELTCSTTSSSSVSTHVSIGEPQQKMKRQMQALYKKRELEICGLSGLGIWVSDSYGLTGKVQPVNPTWGVEGFDPFVSGGIASHHIATGI